MTKDFKTYASSDQTLGQYGLGWMLGGIAIGLLVGLAMYVLAQKGETTAQNPAAPGTTSPVVNTQPVPGATNVAASTVTNLAPADTPLTPDTHTPGFSYHAVLPQLEVDVPIAVQPEQTSTPADNKKDTKVTVPATAAKAAETKTTDKAADKNASKPTAAEPAKTALKETKADTVPPAASAGMNGFQIGSYKTEPQASAMHSRLKQHGLNARVERADINGV